MKGELTLFRKVIITFSFILIFTMVMTGCGKVQTTNGNSKSIKPRTPVTMPAQENSNVENGFKNNSIATNPKDLFTYINLTKEDIIKKLGNNYTVIPITLDDKGYEYSDIGLVFTFKDDCVAWIDCTDKIDINGAKPDMTFSQIQEKLGNTSVRNVLIETQDNEVYNAANGTYDSPPNDGNNAYQLEYTFGSNKVVFLSFYKDGRNSMLTIYPAKTVSNLTKINTLTNNQSNQNIDNGSNRIDAFKKSHPNEVIDYSTTDDFENNNLTETVIITGKSDPKVWYISNNGQESLAYDFKQSGDFLQSLTLNRNGLKQIALMVYYGPSNTQLWVFKVENNSLKQIFEFMADWDIKVIDNGFEMTWKKYRPEGGFDFELDTYLWNEKTNKYELQYRPTTIKLK